MSSGALEDIKWKYVLAGNEGGVRDTESVKVQSVLASFIAERV